MNSGALLIGLAILVLAVPLIAGPFRNRRPKAATTDGRVDMGLDQRRGELLTSLRDLDFDYQTGKVSEADYGPLRAQLLAAAAQVLQLEKQQDQEIEDLIRAHREGRSHPVTCPECQTLLQPSDHFCPHCGSRVVTTCPDCGERLQATHNYCPKCGASQTHSPTPEPVTLVKEG